MNTVDAQMIIFKIIIFLKKIETYFIAWEKFQSLRNIAEFYQDLTLEEFSKI